MLNVIVVSVMVPYSLQTKIRIKNEAFHLLTPSQLEIIIHNSVINGGETSTIVKILSGFSVFRENSFLNVTFCKIFGKHLNNM